MNMEAGIEHFGRGIDNGVDLILIIIDHLMNPYSFPKKSGNYRKVFKNHFITFSIK